MTLEEAWDRVDVVIDVWDASEDAGASVAEVAALRLQFYLLEAYIGGRRCPEPSAPRAPDA